MRTFFSLLLCACTSRSAGMDDSIGDGSTIALDGPLDSTAMVCAPQELTDFMPAFVPPVPRQNACTSPQIQAFYDKCVGAQSSQACQLWQTGNTSCNACLATPDSEVAWGALVLRPGGYEENRSGCVATLGYLDCAKALDTLWACTAASCQDACPGGGLASCRTAASAGVCKMYRSDADAVCPMDAASLSLCLQEGLEKFYLAFAPILCSSGG